MTIAIKKTSAALRARTVAGAIWLGAAIVSALPQHAIAVDDLQSKPQTTRLEEKNTGKLDAIGEKEYRQGLQKEGLIPADAGLDKSSAQAESAKNATPENPVNMHRVKMRLFGSLCASCLRSLERKIKSLEGVTVAKIDGPDKTARAERFPGASSRFAALTVDYDSNKLPLSTILEKIRFNDFNPSKVEDKELDPVHGKASRGS